MSHVGTGAQVTEIPAAATLWPSVTCGRCGCRIMGVEPHVCFGNYVILPARLCGCGQPADSAHFCTVLAVPALRYPMVGS